ncbi:hypothetical protein RF11_15518 [Thelohanellus kitauei]|uniref:Uncharacterized protein n=1 Tax=Thelohanellus kitauei TaxID=669202 RepID=A0A0C2JTY1_THEKT|nr:hypothetical protein RF11_15518 [Thelohanellus kitauei]
MMYFTFQKDSYVIELSCGGATYVKVQIEHINIIEIYIKEDPILTITLNNFKAIRGVQSDFKRSTIFPVFKNLCIIKKFLRQDRTARNQLANVEERCFTHKPILIQ